MRKPDASVFGGASSTLRVIRLDVTDESSVASALNEGIAAFGGIDVLVNDAGIGLFSAFEATPLTTVRELFETNTFGVMAVTQAVIPHMRDRGKGVIVNVTSSVCFAGMPLVAAYASSKFAVEGFSEALFYELSSVGVRVELVGPGYGPGTAFMANSADRIRGLIPQGYQAYARQLMETMRNPDWSRPQRRWPTPYLRPRRTIPTGFGFPQARTASNWPRPAGGARMKSSLRACAQVSHEGDDRMTHVAGPVGRSPWEHDGHAQEGGSRRAASWRPQRSP